MIEVKEINSKETYDYLLNIHYAKRIPSISYAYGLFEDNELIGVVTYGTPSSAPLRKGICGDDFQKDILELNRLCLKYNHKNEASMLVTRSIKLLPRNFVIVSFADTAQGHLGIVYQACNFIYVGLSAKRTDWKVKGREHLHGQTIADEFRGLPNRAKLMREKYGDDFYLAPRPLKHKYLLIKGDKRYKKKVLSNLKYKIEKYPKN